MKRIVGFQLSILLTLALIMAACQTKDAAPEQAEDMQEQSPSAPSDIDERYVAGDLGILIDLGVLTNADIDKDTYITTMEALAIVHGVCVQEYYDDTYLPLLTRDWYRISALEPMDALDDLNKMILLDLTHERVISIEEIPALPLDARLSNYDALRYVTRLVGNTYDCTDYPEELDFTDILETYNRAFEKGFIDEIDPVDADKPVLRADFLCWIHKALFVERFVGGIAGPSEEKYVDYILLVNESRKKRIERAGEEIAPMEIPSVVTIHDDLSITWELSGAHIRLQEEKASCSLDLITDTGEIIPYGYGAIYRIAPEEIIEYFWYVYPEILSQIKISYREHDDDYITTGSWYFLIDMSSISMVIDGEEIKPGVYTHYKRQWVPESISLAAGESFHAGCYYLINSYNTEFRKPEYNDTNHAVFKAESTTNTIHAPDGKVLFSAGNVYIDNAHIQEVVVQGDAQSGFLLSYTPESTDVFQRMEGSERVY